MPTTGFYFLKERGQLFYLPGELSDPDVMKEAAHPSTVQLWPFDPTIRATAWTIVVEALAGYASRERINFLARYWGLDGQDAFHYAHYLGVGFSVNLNKISKLPEFRVIVSNTDHTDKFTRASTYALEPFVSLAQKLKFKPNIKNHSSFKEAVLKFKESKGGVQ